MATASPNPNRKRLEQGHFYGVQASLQNLLVEILDRIDRIERIQESHTETWRITEIHASNARSEVDELMQRLRIALNGELGTDDSGTPTISAQDN